MADTTANTVQEHDGLIVDSDTYFTIDPITRNITGDSGKISLMQYDHNSERFTFNVSKEIEGHDMTNCTIRIHYCNVGGSRNKYNGLYEVIDATLDPDNPDEIRFSWLISQNATKYAGKLTFLIEFTCTKTKENGDVEVWYRWNTNINTDISIVGGMNNNSSVDERYTDIISNWEMMIRQHLTDCDDKLEQGIQDITGWIPTGTDDETADVNVSLKSVTELNKMKKMFIWVGTQEEYDAISDYDEENVFYIIKDTTVAEDFEQIAADVEQLKEDRDSMSLSIQQIDFTLDVASTNINQLIEDVDAVEQTLNDFGSQITHPISTETISSEYISEYSLIDSSFVGREISDSSKIKVDTTTNPLTDNDAVLMTFGPSAVTYAIDGNLPTITFYSIEESDGSLKLNIGEGLTHPVLYANNVWNTVAIEEFKLYLSGSTIMSFNTSIQWNDWLSYETVGRVEEIGYLKKPDGNYFLPFTRTNLIQSIYKDFVSGTVDSDGYITLLHGSLVPEDKTIDDIFAISFKSDSFDMYFNAIKCRGNMFHFEDKINSMSSNEYSIIFYDVLLNLEQSSNKSIKAIPSTSIYKFPYNTDTKPSVDSYNGVWGDMKDILIYFK